MRFLIYTIRENLMIILVFVNNDVKNEAGIEKISDSLIGYKNMFWNNFSSIYKLVICISSLFTLIIVVMCIRRISKSISKESIKRRKTIKKLKKEKEKKTTRLTII